MTDYKIDWSHTDIDGHNTLSGPDGHVGLNVHTPENNVHADWDVSHFAGDERLVSTCQSGDHTVSRIYFDETVDDVSFNLYDVDAKAGCWEDQVTIWGLTADGRWIPATYSGVTHQTVDGACITGGANQDAATDPVNVTFAEPITQIYIAHSVGPNATQSGSVAIGDIHFDVADDLDGTVEGTAGGDLIDFGYDGDPDGDTIDAGDALINGAAPDDDLVLAGDGNDTVYGRAGDDEVYGGAGDDILDEAPGTDDADGNDTYFGGAGNDKIWTGNDADTAYGGTGDDHVNGEAGDDLVYGGAGSDTLIGSGGNDTLIGGGVSFDGKLDFNDLAAGDIVNGQYSANGVTISGGIGGQPVMIFDTANPTGGDHDLATSNLGNVLILSEDGDQSDPDDDAAGGTFVFDFDTPAHVESLGFLDIERGAWIKLYDVDGNLIGQIDTATTADNGQLTQPIGVDGVARMEVIISGSGAIDNLCYKIDGTTSDEADVIKGGDGDDYIDGQLGNDMLFGGSGNDEIYGGAGDDKVEASAGEDTVFGGAGNDDIWGGKQDDVLFGGDGADNINGGDDADVIFGGAGDTVDGGAGGNDYDILDLTGQGPFYVAGPGGVGQPVPDSNGNGLDGQIVFVDGDGNPTGDVIDFVEIEEIIGDQVNRDPDAQDDGFAAGEDDAPAVIGNVLDNDSDPDGDALTVGAVNGDSANVGQPVAGDNGGLVTIGEDGTVTFDPNGDFEALGQGEEATTTVTYLVDDGEGGTEEATVTITVTGVNDGPDATDNAYTVSLTETAGDVDGNAITDNTGAGTDSDPENDPLSVVAVAGAAGAVGTAVAGDNGGLFTINADGSVDFDANGEFDDLGLGDSRDTTVTYTISDGNGGTDTATVTFTVEGVNDGTVQGTNGDDVINPDIPYVDGDGDIVDGNDAILPGDTGNDDLILGFDGNDSIAAGDGDDEVFGGTGNDIIRGDAGNDTLSGDEGDDMVFGGIGDDALFGGDGNDKLEGQAGSDLLDGGDGNDDIWAGSSNDTVFGGAGDDTIAGGGQDDLLVGGTGNDVIDGGNGNDSIRGGDGEDTITGDIGNDTINGGDDNDLIDGGDGDDTLSGNQGDDTVLGGAGNDVINGNTGDDSIDGGTGDDDITGGQGSDVVEGGDGNDVINTGNHADPATDYDYPGDTVPGLAIGDNDPDPTNDLDTVSGGAGDDTITTGDDDDFVDGGTGNDFIDVGIDDDSVIAGAGNDTVIGSQGSDTIEGNDGDDLLYGGLESEVLQLPDAIDPAPDDNIDTIFGGAGNDTIFGRDDDDILFGGTGDDVIDGGIDEDSLSGDDGNDTLIGGQGDDTLDGGEGADVVFGGADQDTIIGGVGDTVDGGTDGVDFDILDLRGLGPLRIVGETVDADGDSTSGTVEFLDGDGNVTGSMTFAEIENVIPCFTPGTMIATPRGERAVEELQVGDKIITRDNGIQEIAWVGHKEMSGTALARSPHLKPILIKAGSLGGGLPERDMIVSPNHRVLVASEKTQLYFEEREVLAAAKHMVGAEGIMAIDTMRTTYVHFMFERHEVVLSNGAWTESFQPGDYSLKGIGNSQRNEIFELFPELQSQQGLENYQAARKALKKHEAKLLLK